MSQTYVNTELRQLITVRADGLCEYCLIAEEDTFLGCEIDHVISEKHGGLTDAENLAFACVFCNQAKGSDIGSIHEASGAFVRFFNPRRDRWGDHFALSGKHLRALTAIGDVTAKILGFNRPNRLMEREALQRLGRYPSLAALQRIHAKLA